MASSHIRHTRATQIGSDLEWLKDDDIQYGAKGFWWLLSHNSIRKESDRPPNSQRSKHGARLTKFFSWKQSSKSCSRKQGPEEPRSTSQAQQKTRKRTESTEKLWQLLQDANLISTLKTSAELVLLKAKLGSHRWLQRLTVCMCVLQTTPHVQVVRIMQFFSTLWQKTDSIVLACKY